MSVPRLSIGPANQPSGGYSLPLCVTLSDPSALAWADLVPTSGHQLYGKVVAGRLLEERAMVLDQLRHAGVLTVDSPADQLTPATINRYLEMKERALL